MEKTITITEEQFREAVFKAQDKFNAIGAKSDNNADSERRGMAELMLGLQNMMFSSILQRVLFNDESEDNK